jgi:hypothetical protein
MLYMIDRFNPVPVQKLGQFTCVVAIVFVADFPQAIFARVAD